MTNPIFCAVDRPDLEGTLALARALAPHVGGIKLGLEFFTAQGPRGVEAVAALGLPIFLDLKLHDIPNTVAGAVREVARLGVAMLTLHAAGGRAMLEAAVAAAAAAPRRPWLLGVTVLTSLDEADLAATGVAAAPAEQAAAAGAARASTRAWTASSARRWRSRRCARALGAGPRLVVPGIRPGGRRRRPEAHHGRRPRRWPLGADILVIGRPITRGADPRRGGRGRSGAAAAARPPEMAPQVKICGLTEPARVEQAGAAGRRLRGLRLLSALAALRRSGAGARARGRRAGGRRRPWA